MADRNGLRNELAVHACVLMTNHVHLLVVPGTAQNLSRTMRSLRRRYVRHVSARYRCTGTLWAGRYRARARLRDSLLSARKSPLALCDALDPRGRKTGDVCVPK